MIRTLLLALTVASVSLSASVKLSYVELEKALLATSDGKQAKAKIDSETKKVEAKLKKMDKDLTALDKELSDKTKKLSKSERAKRQTQLNEKKAEARNYYMDIQQKLGKMQQDTMAPILQRADLVLQKLESQGSYTHIFNNSEGFMFYGAPRYDLTASFTNAYEAAFGKKDTIKLPTKPVTNGKTVKIGVVDMEKAVAQLNSAMKMTAKLGDEYKKRMQVIELMKGQYEKLKSELQALDDSVDEKKKALKEDELAQMEEKLQMTAFKMQQEWQQFEQGERMKLSKEFHRQVASIAKANQFSFVLNENVLALPYAKQDLDITAELVEHANATSKTPISGKTLTLDKMNIAFVDLEQAINQVKESSVLQKDLMKDRDEKLKELSTEAEAIKKLKSQLAKQKSILKPDAYNKKNAEIQQREMQAAQTEMMLGRELEMRKQKEQMQILQKMKTILETIGKDKGYTLVVNKSPATLLFGKPASDITNLAIRKYNAAYSS